MPHATYRFYIVIRKRVPGLSELSVWEGAETQCLDWVCRNLGYLVISKTLLLMTATILAHSYESMSSRSYYGWQAFQTHMGCGAKFGNKVFPAYSPLAIA